MAEEPKTSRLAVFFAQHGEKVGLGVAASALLIFFVFGVFLAEPNTGIARVKSADGAIDDRVRTSTESSPPKRTPQSGPALAPYVEVPPVTPGNNWAMSYVTRITVDPKKETGTERAKPAALPPLTLSVQEVSIDGIALTWSLGKVSDDKKEVKPDYYVVEKKSGAGDWEEIARLRGDPKKKTEPSTAHTDTAWAPKTSYRYRVAAETEGVKATKVVSNEVEARSVGIFQVTFRSIIPGHDGEKGKVWLEIVKSDQEYKRVSVSRIQVEGERVGWWPEKDGEEPTSKHYLSLPGGRGAEIDFDTGWTIKEIKEFKTVLEYVVCDPVYGAGGVKIKCNKLKKTKPFSTSMLVYIDDEGRPQTRYAKEPKAQDELCADCDGTPATTGPTPEEIKERHEKAAQALLAEAEKAWAASEWRKAVDKYDELKKRFSDTEAFKKKAKAIEDNIRKGRENLKK
ncbi:MAG: fibronectin type III domain-containing protein [Planctomycetes bacterium]|nr:fibronectin type III domain-containing protein [Planctomycetota bacterium]